VAWPGSGGAIAVAKLYLAMEEKINVGGEEK